MINIKKGDIPNLLFSIIVCQAAGVLGSIFTKSSVTTWYPTLQKPWFTPSGGVISTVWILLFTLMGVSLFLVLREGFGRSDIKVAVYVFAAQLVVNVLWSFAFFGLRSPPGGIIVIALLWLLILQTIVRFRRISGEAALLLVPYIVWVSFAAFLNYTIWRLNP